MEIKITLDSRNLQDKFDRGGPLEIVKALNEDLYIQGSDRSPMQMNGDVWDEFGTCGTWEIVRA